jgi:hypothetical protein
MVSAGGRKSAGAKAGVFVLIFGTIRRGGSCPGTKANL